MRIAVGSGLLIMALCTRVYAQNAVETSNAPIQELKLRSYRHLLIPIGELDVRTELDISAEQYSIYREYFDKHRVSFPLFRIFVESDAGVSKFLDFADKHVRENDVPFKRFFEEVLLPGQSDKLLGIHLIEHGLIGYEHPAWKVRLELSADQLAQLKGVISQDRKQRREKWTSGAIAKNGDDDSALDMRDNRRLSVANKCLSQIQREVLASILRVTPQRTSQRLSLGF